MIGPRASTLQADERSTPMIIMRLGGSSFQPVVVSADDGLPLGEAVFGL
jgi:hypothetical protein